MNILSKRNAEAIYTPHGIKFFPDLLKIGNKMLLAAVAKVIDV